MLERESLFLETDLLFRPDFFDALVQGGGGGGTRTHVGRVNPDSSLPGDLVLDVFGGSGSTLIACEQTKRRGRLVELDAKYCDVIVERWQNLTDGLARRLSDGAFYNDLVTEDE